MAKSAGGASISLKICWRRTAAPQITFRPSWLPNLPTAICLIAKCPHHLYRPNISSADFPMPRRRSGSLGSELCCDPLGAAGIQQLPGNNCRIQTPGTASQSSWMLQLGGLDNLSTRGWIVSRQLEVYHNQFMLGATSALHHEWTKSRLCI